MSVLSVKLRPDNRGGKYSIEGDEYELVFVVLTSSVDDGPLQIVAAVGNPSLNESPVVLGQIYAWKTELDPSALCQEIAPRKIGPTQWEATCRFAPLDRSTGDRQQPPQCPDPFQRPPEIVWDNEPHQHIIWRAARLNSDNTTWTYNAPVVNSAGGMFSAPLMRQANRPTLAYSRVEAVFPQGYAQYYQDSTNTLAFLGWAPGTALCKKIVGSWKCEKYQNDYIRFWWVIYNFVFDTEGFYDWILDQGNFYLEWNDASIEAGGQKWEKVIPRDKSKVPMHGPFLLDGNGGLLNGNGTIVPDDPDQPAADPVYLPFNYRAKRDFTDMNIVIPG